MVTATIGDFAFGTAVKTTAVSPWLYTKGALLGIGTTIIAALGPLREATRIDPASAMLRSNLERRTRGAMKGALLIALLLTLVGVALLVVATTSLWIAFGALFLILFAAALATPSAVAWLAHLAEPLLRIALRSTGALAARNASAQQSRIAVASASLTLAVAAVIGIGLMVSSFRDSLTAWLGTTLTADVYVTTTGENLPPITLETARADSDVTSLSTTRFAALPTEFGTLRVRAYTPSARGWGLDIVDGDVSQVQRLLEAGGHVAVAEPFAYRNSLRRGDTLNLPTANGKRAFEIAGIYRDYNTGGASVLMSGAAYREHWGDGSVSGIGLDLVSGADAGAVSERLRVATGPQNLRITTTEGIKAISQNVFDRTFRITEVLRLLAAVVAFLGILSALMSIQFEREHEFNVLRAIGFSPRRLAALIMTETSLVGTAAGIAAIPTGIGLAALLVYVINRRSFGWTMELTLHPAPIVSGFALAAAAAVLAGIVPSLNGYRRGAGQTMTK
jgi:putative ABC transport system permease protein